MYEPKVAPNISTTASLISDMRLGIKYCRASSKIGNNSMKITI